jgi:hypothetical protein
VNDAHDDTRCRDNERTILDQHLPTCNKNKTLYIAFAQGDLPAGNTVPFTPNVSAPFPPKIEEYPPNKAHPGTKHTANTYNQLSINKI